MASESKVLTDPGYARFLKDLRRIIEEGKREAQAQASQVLVETTWRLGKRIKEEGLAERAGYGDSIMEDVAEDLGMDASTLRRAVVFFEQNEISAPRRTNLAMAHHWELLTLSDPEEREFYAELADREALTRDALREAVKRRDYEAKPGGKAGKKAALKRPQAPTYLYKALVERAVDGDTLVLRIDLGFQVWKEQRVRLAGINALPLDEAQGYKAFEYVRDQMAKAAFVLVKTNKIDIYGRYVADLFYSFKEKDPDLIFREGRWLNQELLDLDFARRS